MNDWEKKWAEQEKRLNAALERNKELDDGVVVGKTFRTQVGDGFAFYEVTAVEGKSVTVEWRDYHPDDWRDQVLGDGGTFPYDSIDRIITSAEGIDRVFGRR